VNLIEKLASESILTEEQVERIGKNVSSFLSQYESDPHFRKEAAEKLGWKNLAKGLAPEAGFFERAYAQAHDVAPLLAGSVGLGALIGTATDYSGKAIDAIKKKAHKASSFKTMMNKNPHLSEADPGEVEDAFNTLYRFNPAYAEDPLVAGTFVKNVLDQERVDIGTVSNLVGAHKQITEANKRRSGKEFFMNKVPMGAMSAGGGSIGGPNSLSNLQVLTAQKNMETAEKEYEAAKNKAQFWEGSEAVPADDPRLG
jgi:hypothetical protein